MHSVRNAPLLLTCTLLVLACHDLTPRQQARLDRFECQARALAEVVEPTIDAAALLTDLYAGKADLAAVLGAVAATRAEAEQLIADLKACGTVIEGPAAPVEPAAVRVVW
jgi:hypothetical protein